MAHQILDAQMWTQKERWKKGKSKRKGEGKEKERQNEWKILCQMLCIALDRQ